MMRVMQQRGVWRKKELNNKTKTIRYSPRINIASLGHSVF